MFACIISERISDIIAAHYSQCCYLFVNICLAFVPLRLHLLCISAPPPLVVPKAAGIVQPDSNITTKPNAHSSLRTAHHAGPTYNNSQGASQLDGQEARATEKCKLVNFFSHPYKFH